MPEKNGVLAVGSPALDFETDAGLSDFDEEWIDLVDSVRGRGSTDPEEALSNSVDNFERAHELAFNYPERIDVYENACMDTVHEPSPSEHVREHFDNLLNDEDIGVMLKFPPDEEYLRKACELVYIDDCVFRFSKSTVFKISDPEFNPSSGYRKLIFVNLPDELGREYARWMEKMELLWNSFASGAVLNKEETKEMIDEMYEEREKFIRHAIENDIFLPIPTSDPAEAVDSRRDHIDNLVSRRNEVNPEEVHEYCYSVTLDYIE